MRLLSFELKKIVFSKKFLYILLGIVIGIGFLMGRNVIFESNIEKEAREQIDELLEVNFANAKIHNSILEDDPENEEQKELRRLNSAMINNLYETRNLLAPNQFQERLKLQNEYYSTAEEYKQKGGEHSLTYQEISHSLALNEKLLESEIPPEHETYSRAFPNFIKQVVDLFINLGAILIIILLVGEIMSSEFENRSINLLFTQPLKRTHIITSKLLSSIIVYVLTTAFLLAVALIIGYVFGYRGFFDYPIVVEVNQQIEFITIAEYLLIAVIVVSVSVFLIITLCVLLSLFFKNTLATLFSVLGILLAGYVLISTISWSPMAWFNPFQYLLPEEIILVQNAREWWQGIPVTLLLTIMLYVIARQKVRTSKVD
ncbi:ABC transporter permease [Ornithinibacillus californiensis]|uniref:ABC transporter permease n=1 Tax=Ornithinibacillus californiensis TaxID=161536 RepID=UPI00064D9879|nr:ABC transporter permease subunit [Ornithinibacillus californiensis]